MKRATNENTIPKWVADIFKTKKEKRSEQDQLDLDRYVADLRFTDPERYERLQAILSTVDPDTGRIPAGLNTGNVDESVLDDIKASPNKFTNWEYKDPKDPSLGRRLVSKGRNAKEAALYVKMRYPEYPNLNPQYFEDTGVRVSLIDRYVEAIYNGETEAPERGEMPYFMRETNNKMKKSNLMEMIREVIAEEMGSSATDMSSYKVMLDYTPLKFIVSINDAKALEGIQSGDFLNGEFDTNVFDDNKKYKVSPFEQKREDGSVIRTLRIFDIGDGTIKENKMKVNQLRQIIREEISKVLKENASASPFERWKEVKLRENPKLKNLTDEQWQEMYDEWSEREARLDRWETDDLY